MWQDLAALTPPLVVCVAFLIGLAMLLRRQMAPKRRAEQERQAPIARPAVLKFQVTTGLSELAELPNWAVGLAADPVSVMRTIYVSLLLTMPFLARLLRVTRAPGAHAGLHARKIIKQF